MNYYYHGVGEFLEYALRTMLEIIESGGIMSKNMRKTNDLTLYNGDDYISVAKWEEGFDYDKYGHLVSAFYGWIYNLPVFIISPDIEAIHAKMVPIGRSYDSSKERVSQFVDEWHVRDIIPLDKIVGIALPFDEKIEDPFALGYMRKIIEYAKFYGWKVYNSNMDLVKSVENDETYDKTRKV